MEVAAEGTLRGAEGPGHRHRVDRTRQRMRQQVLTGLLGGGAVKSRGTSSPLSTGRWSPPPLAGQALPRGVPSGSLWQFIPCHLGQGLQSQVRRDWPAREGGQLVGYGGATGLGEGERAPPGGRKKPSTWRELL